MDARSQKMRKQSGEQSRVIKPYLTPTIPPRASAHPGKSIKKRSLPAYDLADVKTVPPASGSADISLLDTVEQECYRQKFDKHVSNTYTQYMDGTKKTSKSSLAAPAAPLKDDERPRNLLPLNPLESVRWWLLYPGRIEFLLWSGGTLLLLLITIILIVATMLSLHILN
jgi:hypothetical protein